MRIVLLVILLIGGQLLFGQIVREIHRGEGNSRSYYDLEQISADEMWISGEDGLLVSIDTSGNSRQIFLPEGTPSILKVLRHNGYVYLACDKGIVFRYDPKTDEFIRKSFQEFEKRCFYDLTAMPDGDLLIVGGTSGISLGEKRIPRGFMAKLSPDLSSMEVVWESYRHFVWSVTSYEEIIYASVFDGMRSKVLSSSNGLKWQKYGVVKGLIHEIYHDANAIWYSGTRTINYKRKGIAGKLGGEQKILNKTGCLWAIESLGDSKLLVSQSGKLLALIGKEVIEIPLPVSPTLYEIESFGNNRMVLAGHGGQLFFIDFSALTIPFPVSQLPDER